tara:strand:- start:3184 stop:3363 length:180 start_codon:yes stop_codon:yes gene_type:complete
LRAFGFHDPSELNPFLLFDDFRNQRPEDFEKGLLAGSSNLRTFAGRGPKGRSGNISPAL